MEEKETIHIHMVIDKDVTCCAGCPLYDTDSNMGATLSICGALPSKDWKNVLNFLFFGRLTFEKGVAFPKNKSIIKVSKEERN